MKFYSFHMHVNKVNFILIFPCYFSHENVHDKEPKNVKFSVLSHIISCSIFSHLFSQKYIYTRTRFLKKLKLKNYTFIYIQYVYIPDIHVYFFINYMQRDTPTSRLQTLEKEYRKRSRLA